MTTNNIFPSAFDESFVDILEHKYTEYVYKGGRGSCKSSFISVAFVRLWLCNPNFNGVVFRKYANTLSGSVYQQIAWAINKLGVSDRVIFRKSPLQIINKETKQVILFSGCDDPEKTKSLKCEKGYFSLIWYEELTEFSQKELIDTKLSVMRGGSVYWVFESFNPPSSARNWVNTETRHSKKDCSIHSSSYLTTPPEWLGEPFFNEAEELKKNNLRAYENIFLGKPTGTGVNIFENVELRPITNEEIKSFDYFYYGMDFGYYPDPLLYNGFSYNAKTKTIYIFDELKLLKHGNWEASDKLKEHLKQFYKTLGYENYNYMGDRITGDSAEPKTIADFRQWGWNMRGAVKGKGSLEAGIKWLQTRAKIIIDPARCPEAADEFSLFEYDIDRKTGEIMSGVPDGQPDHSIAALRYGSEQIWHGRGI